MSEEINIGWAAGLFEGEGTFYLRNRNDRKHLYARAQVQMTDKDIVERFCSIVGIGIISKEIIPKNEKHKSSWQWTISGYDKVEQLYNMFKPFLGERRLKQGKRVLDNAANNRTLAKKG